MRPTLTGINTREKMVLAPYVVRFYPSKTGLYHVIYFAVKCLVMQFCLIYTSFIKKKDYGKDSFPNFSYFPFCFYDFFWI